MSSKSIWQSQGFIIAILIVVFVLSFLSLIQPSVQAISTVGMETWEVQLVSLLKFILNTGSVAVLSAFGWTLFGYLRYKVGDSTVQYDLTKLGTTVTWFLMFMLPLTYATNSYVGVGATTIIMAVKAVMNNFNEELSEPAPTASTPSPAATPSTSSSAT